MSNLHPDRIKIIAFDADDTLWRNETIFVDTEAEIKKVLASYVPDVAVFDQKLLDYERKNLRLFGYGIKGFMLSVIETSIELTEGLIRGSDVQRIIDLGKQMLEHPVHLLDGVEETIRHLDDYFRLMVITKGDLFDQENKLARSGIGELFEMAEIVSEKDPATYRRVFARYGIDPAEVLMVGNSVKSDILPTLAVGAQAIHIPFETTWELERVEPSAEDEFLVLTSIRELTQLLNVPV